MTKIFALTTRGLEAVSAGEIGALPGVTVDQIAYRRVAATCTASLKSLLTLRTVDDVFVDVAKWLNIGRHRSALATLGALSAKLNLREAAAICGKLRRINRQPFFSITANFVGKRNYNTQEIKQVCAEEIAKRHTWTYTDDDAAADLNVRIFIEHEIAFVGVRLAAHPLYRRPYKQYHVSGSLKPSVAAALLYLVEAMPGVRLLDPCCGAGTILIEGALYGMRGYGGDNDVAAIAASQANINAIGNADNIGAQVQLWDARALPLADRSVDRIVTNLPWGRMVTVDTALKSFYRQVGAEMCRVLAPNGQIALLTSLPDLVRLEDLRCHSQIEISLFGQNPTIMLFCKNKG